MRWSVLVVAAAVVGCPGPEQPAPCQEPCVVDAGDSGSPLPTDDGGHARRDAGEGFDAGTPDDGGVFDWRTVRGAPFRLEVVSEALGEPRALFGHTYAMARCDAGRCTWTWRGDAGEVLLERAGVAEHSDEPYSPDGRLHSGLAFERAQTCMVPEGLVDELVGSALLIDLESGAEQLRTPSVTTFATPDPAFTSSSRWWRFYESPTCSSVRVALRSTRPPHAAPLALAALPTAFVSDDLPDGDLVGDEQGASFVVSPDDAGSLVRFTTDSDSVQRSGAWFHAWASSPVRGLTHFDTRTKQRRTTPVDFQTTDFVIGTAFGRYATLPALALDVDGGVRRVDLIDGAGEFPTRSVQSRSLTGRNRLVVAHAEDFAIFSPAGSQALARLDLRSGTVTSLDVRAGTLRVLGNGRLVAASNANDVHLLFRDRVESLSNVVALYGFDGSRPAPLPQDDVVFLVTASPLGGERSLVIFNTATGRRVRVTDSLFFNPPFGAAFFADEACAAPGFVRSVGPPVQSGLQATSALHFTEFVPAVNPTVRLFTVPLDLSGPPRLLAEVPPDQCAPPLAARDGSRWWVPVRGFAGVTRAVFARP
ncbi:MAG: hypothetical protein SFW67_06470 [Myxococcaceae bacterium]|nr:hypothetical protein [Myxococcaceae bacterium]